MDDDLEVTALYGAEFVPIVCDLINKTKSSIEIVIFDWRVYPVGYGEFISNFNKSIISALGRGVAVSVVVNNSRHFSLFEKEGALVREYHGKRMIHSKLMICDDKNVVIGSHNYTESAFTSNIEISALISGLPVDNEFKKIFNNLWGL